MFFNAVQIGIGTSYALPACQPIAGATASEMMKQGILEFNQQLSDLIKKQD
jgi:hypothetical protein